MCGTFLGEGINPIGSVDLPPSGGVGGLPSGDVVVEGLHCRGARPFFAIVHQLTFVWSGQRGGGLQGWECALVGAYPPCRPPALPPPPEILCTRSHDIQPAASS